MDDRKSREALAEFLDYLAQKGLLADATARARKAAASKILGILDDQEAQDITEININDVVARFQRLHGKRYTPESLLTYKSRLKSALTDFVSYLDNPLAFRSSTQTRERSKKTPDISGNQINEPRVELRNEHRQAAIASSNILPIPLRPDLIIYIQGLPFDLKESEAKKIAAVVAAMTNFE